METVSYTKRVYKRNFFGINTKDAYLKACKWYATNIIANNKINDICVEYVKSKTGPSVTMFLYASISVEEIKNRHCECCREISGSFLSGNKDCDTCKAVSFQRRIDDKLLDRARYYKDEINKIIKKERENNEKS